MESFQTTRALPDPAYGNRVTFVALDGTGMRLAVVMAELG